MKPNELILFLREHLQSYVTTEKGTISIAPSAFDVIEMLAESPGGFRVILLWEGDQDATGVREAGIVNTTLAVVVSHNRGLAVWRGDKIMDDRLGTSLLTHVHDVRAQVRACEFPAEVTSVQPLYLGCAPEVAPEGLPLDAYRLRFQLTNSIVPAA